MNQTAFKCRRLPAILLAISLTVALSGCEEPPADEPSDEPEVESSVVDDHHTHDDNYHDHDIELAQFMFDVSLRVAAIWFAGEANNTEMVEYQIHELEEIVDDIRAAAPEEAGIDIVEYFDTQILTQLEKAEEAIEEGDQEGFVAAYDAALTQCNSCHGATGYDFIRVVRPERNPYTNLDFTPAE